MVNNIIRINRQEFDRLKDLTELAGYEQETFRIAQLDLFPLHEIHFIIENLNPGETYEIDTTIKVSERSHSYKCIVYYRHRCVGVVSAVISDYDNETFEWKYDYKVKAIQRGKESWLCEVALMISTLNMICSYSILHADSVFLEDEGTHRLCLNSKSDSDEIIYKKLKSYVSLKKKTRRTGLGPKPQHEFDVRGHMRKTPSGGYTYVRPHTKCQGRGTKIIHEYALSEGEE